MYIVGRFFNLRAQAAVKVNNDFEATIVKELLNHYELLTNSTLTNETDIALQQGLLITLKKLMDKEDD